MRHMPENCADTMAIAIKVAFEQIHIDKTLSLKTAQALARAAISAGEAWNREHGSKQAIDKE